MNGPTGYNVRYRRTPESPVIGLRVAPSQQDAALDVYEALLAAGMSKVEIWRSGERLRVGGSL